MVTIDSEEFERDSRVYLSGVQVIHVMSSRSHTLYLHNFHPASGPLDLTVSTLRHVHDCRGPSFLKYAIIAKSARDRPLSELALPPWVRSAFRASWSFGSCALKHNIILKLIAS